MKKRESQNTEQQKNERAHCYNVWEPIAEKQDRFILLVFGCRKELVKIKKSCWFPGSSWWGSSSEESKRRHRVGKKKNNKNHRKSSDHLKKKWSHCAGRKKTDQRRPFLVCCWRQMTRCIGSGSRKIALFDYSAIHGTSFARMFNLLDEVEENKERASIFDKLLRAAWCAN